MAEVTYDNATCIYPGAERPAVDAPRAGHQGRRVRGHGRPVGVRQDDGAADAGRPGGDRRRGGPDRRQGHDRRAVPRPRHRDGLPELRAVPEQDGRREHGLRAQDAGRGQGRTGPPGRRGGQAARPGAAARPQAAEPVRRAAAAGGHGPRHRPRAQGLLHGRAAVQPGRAAAGADPHPDRRAAAAAAGDHGLRDPRPGGSDDHGRPGGRHAGRAAPAVRLAHRAVRPARPTFSWRRSSARPR